MTCFARKAIAGKGLRRLNLSIALEVPDEMILAISGEGTGFLFWMQNGFPDCFDSADHCYYPAEVAEVANFHHPTEKCQKTGIRGKRKQKRIDLTYKLKKA